VSKILDIEFATISPFSYNRLTVLGGIMVALALFLFVYMFQQYQQASDDLAAVELKRMAILPKPKQVSAKPVQETATPEEINYARDILAQLSIPWQPLFTSLEQTKPQTIALLGIEPNRKKQQVILTGQAKNMEAALVYLRKLEQTDTLSQVHLLQHSIDQNDPFKPLTFTITARWNL